MHQPDFIRLCLELGVLRFGEFTLKSGRVSPYFFNAGLFNTGHAIAGLGRWYARAAALSGVEFDMLFGPAYKGIPLVTATATALCQQVPEAAWRHLVGLQNRHCEERSDAAVQSFKAQQSPLNPATCNLSL